MKVRMLVSIAGHAEPRYKLPSFSFAPGDVVDLDKKLAEAWIACGHAEKIKKPAAATGQPEPEPELAEPGEASV